MKIYVIDSERKSHCLRPPPLTSVNLDFGDMQQNKTHSFQNNWDNVGTQQIYIVVFGHFVVEMLDLVGL